MMAVVETRIEVHLIDGTYELFRHYYGAPEHLDPDGIDVGAVRGVVRSMLELLDGGATHVGVATDHVVESFRGGTGRKAPDRTNALQPQLKPVQVVA